MAENDLPLFDMTGSAKRCTKCRELKPLSEFHRSKKSSSGLKHYCISCSRDALREWQAANGDHRRSYARQYYKDHPEYREKASEWGRQRYANPNQRDRLRDQRLQREFGITLTDYRDMESAQDGRCAICGEECVTGRALAVDHCHDTGAVRGLLCANCNRAIGLFKDDPERLLSAARYLLAHVDVLREAI